MSNKIVYLLISLIFLIGLFLRTYDIDKIPVSLTVDEVAIGYSAYSILKTGKDENGVFLPLAFKSLGDYKAPLLIYTVVPGIFIFGLNEFGLRIVPALFGSLAIIAVFLLTLEFFKNKFISLAAALSLSLSPWHIKYSRGAYEAILASLLVILGVYFFLIAIRKRGNYFWIAGIFFVLSMYAYHAQRVFIPLLVLLLALIYRKELLINKGKVIIGLIVGIILFIPLFLTLLESQNRIRAEVSFITRDVEINRHLHRADEERSAMSYILDNNFLIALNFWTKRYLEYFDPNFLFLKGMNYSLPKTPDIGLLYLIELPLTFLGLFLVIFKKVAEAKIKILVLGWFLIGIFAASLANNAQHTIRSLTWIPIPQLLSGVGLFYAFTYFKQFRVRLSLLGGYLSLLLISVIYFWVLYSNVYQRLYSEGMMDGWKQAMIFGLENQYKYKEIVIDPRFGSIGPYYVGAPYFYTLFYGQIDPAEFQFDPRRANLVSSADFRNFTFREVEWNSSENGDLNKKDNLYIGSEWVLPPRNDIVHKKFYLLNGKEILRAVSPQ